MTVRSDRLVGPLDVIGGTQWLFTVPPGQTWIVKRACLIAFTPPVGTATWFWIVSDGVQTGWVHSLLLANLGTSDIDAWWALDPGSKLGIQGPAGGTGTAVAFGAKLAGAAT